MLLKVFIGIGLAMLLIGIILLLVYSSYSTAEKAQSTALQISSYVLMGVGFIVFIIPFWIDTRDDRTVMPVSIPDTVYLPPSKIAWASTSKK